MKDYSLTEAQIKAIRPIHDRFVTAVAVLTNDIFGFKTKPLFTDNYEGGVIVNGHHIAIASNFVMEVRKHVVEDIPYAYNWVLKKQPCLAQIEGRSTKEETALTCVIHKLAKLVEREGPEALAGFDDMVPPEDHRSQGAKLRAMLGFGIFEKKARTPSLG